MAVQLLRGLVGDRALNSLQAAGADAWARNGTAGFLFVVGSGAVGAYVLSRVLPPAPAVRAAASVGLSAWMLTAPAAVPTGTFGALAAAVVAFCGAQKATQLLVFGPSTSDDKAVDGRPLCRPFSLAEWAAEYFFMIVPRIRRVRGPAKEVGEVLRDAGICVAVGLAKTYAAKRSGALLGQLDWGAALRDYPTYCLLSAALMGHLLLGTASNDFGRAAVSVLSLGRYEQCEFNNWPVLAVSLRELWAKRYNLHISGFLRDTVMLPARDLGLTTTQAALGAYLASGLLHAYVSHFAFEGGELRSFTFFVLSGAAAYFEPSVTQGLPTWAKWALTQGFTLLTMPLYVGLFVEHMPGFIPLPGSPAPKADAAASE